MTTVQLIALALVQGLTEFLPISSSGHLILLPRLTGWPDQGLAFDIAAHFGSLIAVVFYFRADLKVLIRDWTRSVVTRSQIGDSALAWAVLFGTIPTGIAGILAHDLISTELRTPAVIAFTTVFFGAALWWSDYSGARSRGLASLRARDVLVIGCAQALALVPGTSRSGITMTAALMLGLSRDAAARFSFLLSIPIIVLASGLETVELFESRVAVDWTRIALVTLFSAISAYLCIHWFLALIGRMGMAPFALYRFALGGVLWWFFV